jgi:hypothetical protein
MLSPLNPISALPATPPSGLALVRRAEATLLQRPQVDLTTDHLFHAGVYCRTICLPKGAQMTGALIKIATTLIVSGDAEIFTGEGWVRYSGYCVLPASAGRKQAFRTLAETHLTMIFPTDAKTIEAVEAEFTDEGSLLGSRRNLNTVRIGE